MTGRELSVLSEVIWDANHTFGNEIDKHLFDEKGIFVESFTPEQIDAIRATAKVAAYNAAWRINNLRGLSGSETDKLAASSIAARTILEQLN